MFDVVGGVAVGVLDAELPRGGVAEIAVVERVVVREIVHELVELIVCLINPWGLVGDVVRVLVALSLRAAVGSSRALLVFHADDVSPPFLPIMLLVVVGVIINAEVYSVRHHQC